MEGGFSALMLLASDLSKEANAVASLLLAHHCCEINMLGDIGQSALSLAVQNDNKILTELLLRHDANIFNDEI